MTNFTPLELQTYEGQDTDYKVEVIAYTIWKKYQELDGVFLKRLGSNNRSFHKDLKQIKVESQEEGEHSITIESYREGLYDYLPEGLFHPPSFKSSRLAIDEVVEQIRREKRVEQKLRTFFQPFEQEIYFSHLNALAVLDSFDGMEQRNQLMLLFEELWPFLKLLDDKKIRSFAYLLPHFHAKRGKKDWIEKGLNTLLHIPVRIYFAPRKVTGFDKLPETIVLGTMQLGLTTVLAEDYFDGMNNWNIEFGPIPYEDLHLFLEGHLLRTRLQAFYDSCFPLSATVVETFITLRQEQAFRLENNKDSRLGYSTYL